MPKLRSRNSPYLEWPNIAKTAKMWTIVDPPIEGEDACKPRANFQKISLCRALQPQRFFSTIRFIEIKASLMNDLAVSRHWQVKHRIRLASQPGSGTASLVPSSHPRALHPRLTFANQMPVERSQNGTTCHAGREHSEREHHDRQALLGLQVLWGLRQTQRSSATDQGLLVLQVQV
jgi:hypothetical protein